jgi:HlyD family secretion protein
VVQQSVTMFPVLISITNEDGLLLPGMNGEVSMQVDRRDNVLAVPLDAVRTARELPTVALTLGLDADTVQAQITREIAARVGQRARPGATRPDSTRSWGAGVGTARAESRTARTESSAARTESSATAGAGSGAGSAGREQAGRGQAVLVKTATGIEPRLVRIGLSDFDYAEILGGIKEGEEVVLLSVVEQQAKRTADQSQLKARMGSGIPGSAPAAGGRATGGGH